VQRYVDPFADRSEPEGDHESIEDAPEIDPSLEPDGRGLDAIAEDQVFGRREAPFSADPRHRVRPVGE
jgi:hypothetical protein